MTSSSEQDKETVETTLAKTSEITDSSILPKAAGAGSGTLLVLLAQNLPDTNSYKSWLLIVAPAASVLLSVAFAWAQKAIGDFQDERNFKKLVSQMKDTLRESINDPLLNETDRNELTRQYAELINTETSKYMKKIKILASSEQAK